MGFSLHLLFCICSLRAANGFDFLHPLLHRRFGEKCPLLEFFQHSGSFVLLFESLESTIYRFIFIDNYAYQVLSPPKIYALVNS